ncbi:hypothetical protein [Methylosinus sp. Sm6]|uniref:hypothetical protein n=1 Tax=Methylosinus sp. Sm6 TaxID=2866948 RepID=UPI001C994773|nr:hypothetical protein [Methylosinus sp. Sm6]MBY6242158.1 hypothetical protein [Methylosinus sp. Sm6]
MRKGTTSRTDAARRAPSGPAPAPGLFAERRATPRPRAHNVGENIVRSLGVGLAVASTGFAGYMISDTERRPQFAGIEHLAIYSRPATLAAQRAQMQVAQSQPKVDYSPVGSIGETREPTIPGFRLLEVRAGAALLETPSAIVRVSPGDVVAGLGRITAFERRGDKWVLVTPSGIVAGN